MKRSVINNYLKEAEEIFSKNGYLLPPWASWKPEVWKKNAGKCKNLFDSCLGWDLTDFGSEDFLNRGLLLVTVRNGNETDDEKPYAEKIMLIKENQETPFHFHWSKTEDIINRGGGNLVLELYNSTEDEKFSNETVSFLTDGIAKSVEPGGRVVLTPGESITLKTGVYHRFYAEEGKGPVVAGEVSMTNDDAADNRFYDNCGRFPAVEEDESPYRLLVGDYDSFIKE
ncbi:MAG: D-lyxose/D-mannose family sugar isomerase [Spirochaetales bacterium]|uniref:D-lyxose ketol-isomerase n=1 Tax=Candidatus Thalassospirochaeta sargassi TaxID=3119039 RepID=A0AAJ1MKE5_9SPIO|nr:D-lyxose/D-mannose family sugar isomerase [Spirochaetales bacterium]